MAEIAYEYPKERTFIECHLKNSNFWSRATGKYRHMVCTQVCENRCKFTKRCKAYAAHLSSPPTKIEDKIS